MKCIVFIGIESAHFLADFKPNSLFVDEAYCLPVVEGKVARPCVTFGLVCTCLVFNYMLTHPLISLSQG